MWKALKIKNFQKHRKLIAPLHENLNVVTGSSDQGKSALIRSVLWCLGEYPWVKNYKTHKTKETFVKIETDEGFVKRIKTSSKNDYSTSLGEFPKTGRKTPPEIKQIVPFTTLNYQGQHDGVFLLGETDGEVGRKLNSYVDFDIGSKLQNSVKSFIREKSDEIEDNNSRIKSIKEQLESLPDINLLRSIYRKIKVNRQEHEKTKKILGLANLIHLIEETQKDVQFYKDTENKIQLLLKIQGIISDIDGNSIWKNSLTNIL